MATSLRPMVWRAMVVSGISRYTVPSRSTTNCADTLTSPAAASFSREAEARTRLKPFQVDLNDGVSVQCSTTMRGSMVTESRSSP